MTLWKRWMMVSAVLLITGLTLPVAAFASPPSPNKSVPTKISPTKKSAVHCSGWSVVPSPNDNTAGSSSYLRGLAALNANDAWAVGNTSDGSPLAELWNGKKWTMTPVQVPANSQGSAFESVAVIASNLAWAVGSYYDGILGNFHPLIERWNGSKWSIVPSPPVGNTDITDDISLGTIVRVPGTNDLWAVGNIADPSEDQAFLLHWDGNTWSNDGLYQYSETFTGITAVSSTNIWVAGYNPYTATDTATMYHWDGVNWSDVSITGGDASTNPYYVTNVPGSNFVWALASTMAYPSQTRLIQYSNAGGTIIPNPDPSAALHSIAASSTNNSMAVGNNAFGTFAEHWNGQSWSISKSLNPGGNSTLQSVASIPGTNKYWAVGSYSPYGSITHTLIESYC